MYFKDQNREVPEKTAKLAHKIFKKGNRLLKLRDELGIIYENSEFKELFSHKGRQAEAPGNLVLVLILQYAEGLSDEQAADHVRSRIDWKYLLGLELEDEGFHYDVLQRFRKRLVMGSREEMLLNHLLELLTDQGWLKNKDKQRTDSTHVMGAVRRLNRLELVGETMRVVLEELAITAPRWLERQITAEWVKKYSHRFEISRLPTKSKNQETLAKEIGEDGYALWQSIQAAGMKELEVAEVLRQVWLQQYTFTEEGIRWRTNKEVPPAAIQIRSPHDLQVRYSRKRDEEWVGYKVHFTETCGDRKQINLITDVTTTFATVPDVMTTPIIQKKLIDKGLQPEVHLVDQGYIDAHNLVTSQEKGIDLTGPVPQNTSWQNRDPKGISLAKFAINWQQQIVTCPQGQQSTTWSESHDTFGNKVIHVRFARRHCNTCGDKPNCTRSTKNGRSLKLKPQPEHIALRLGRQRQNDEDFGSVYKTRAGIEGTVSEAVHHHDARQSRYVGFAKTHLHNILTALAINVIRVGRWLIGDPRARTRHSPLESLVFT